MPDKRDSDVRAEQHQTGASILLPELNFRFARRDRKAAMPFIMLAVLIDMVSIGLIIPVLPAWVGHFTGSQADQAFWYGMAMFAFGIANFFASPILGALSDSYGRRPVLLLGFCGLALNFFATALATSLWMLIAVRLVGGAMQANVTVANAYVADITPPEERGRRFGMLGAMFGVGFILGPVMGGLLGHIDLRLPFFVAGSLALLNLLYGCFVLPESLPAREPARVRLAIGQSGRLAARAGGTQRGGAARGRGRLQRARAVRALYLLGALHDFQVRLGSAGKRLVARGGGHHVGDRAGLPAGAACSSAAARAG